MSLSSKGKSRELSVEINSQKQDNIVSYQKEDEASGEDSHQESVEDAQGGVDSAISVRRPRGEIKVDVDESLCWRGSSAELWRSAIYHVEIRDELIEAAKQQGQYVHSREMGLRLNDVTSYLPEHREYGAQRDQRPELLFQYKILNEQMSSYIAPIWIYKERVVLDSDDHPVLDWPEVPATFSSKIEGWLQEFISRKHFQFTLKDFLARIIPGLGNYGTICMRRTRFRLKAGCLSWRKRQGNEEAEVFLDSLLPGHCKLTNSTRGFRDLSGPEMKQMQLAARGYRPKQTRRRPPTRTQRRKAGGENKKNAMKEMHVENENFGDQESVNQGFASQEPRFQERHVREPTNQGPVSQDQETTEGRVGTTTEPNAPEPNLIPESDDADYRYVFPTKSFDRMAIAQALEPTRKHFWLLTGINAPITDTMNDYASQWGALQLEFDTHWQIYGSIGPVLNLVMAEEWFGGFGRLPIVQIQVDGMTFPEFQIAREYYIEYLIEPFQELE